MNACQGEEYNMAKYALSEADILTPSLAVERLRSVEQNVKEAANWAKNAGRPGAGVRGKSNSDWKLNVECYKCHKKGHLARECPDPPTEEGSTGAKTETSRPPNERKTSNQARTGPPGKRDKAKVATEDTPQEEGGPPEDRVWMTTYRHKTQEEEDPPRDRAWMTTYRHKQVKELGWLIDSGATRHMTPQRDLFVKFTPSGGVVEFGNQGELPVAGRGDIQVWIGRQLVTMKDVLYVPKMSVNLLSIAALDRRGFFVHFGRKMVTIIDQQSNQVVANGHVVDGLYELSNCDSDRALTSACTVSDVSDAFTNSEITERVYMRAPEVNVEQAVESTNEDIYKTFELMHKRLGHPGNKRLKDLHLHADGIAKFRVPKDHQCDVCDQSKMVKTINREAQAKTSIPGARMHADFWGPFPVGSIIKGCRIYTFLICEATGRATLRPIESKKEVRPFTTHSIKWLIQEDKRPVIEVRLDNAREYKAMETELWDVGVKLEFVSTYTAYQNGIAERFNRTVVTIARSMLIQSGLPLSFWAEAVVYACRIYNMLPQETRGSKSPDELWFNKKPNLSKLRVFGCQCRVYLAKEQRDTKMDPINYLGIYTGYYSSTQSRVYWPAKNRFEWPTNVIFYEDRQGVDLLPKGLLPKFNSIRADVDFMDPATIGPYSGAAGGSSDTIPIDDDDNDDIPMSGGPITLSPKNDENSDFDDQEPEGVSITPELQNNGGNPQPGPSGHQEEGTSPAANPNNDEVIDSVEEDSDVLDAPNPITQSAAIDDPAPVPGPRASIKQSVISTAASTRPRRERKVNSRIAFDENFGNKDRVHVTTQKMEPQTYQEAVTGPDAREWILAIIKHLEDLQAAGTWRVSDVPAGRRLVSCKWVFKIKYNPDGTIDKYKARLVARGFTQVENIDFQETFAPTMRFESLRLLFAIAILYGLMIHQLDVDNAYLNSDLWDEIYMVFPEGLTITPNMKGKALQLLKGLFGLKQSARIWNEKFEAAVKKIGFKSISSDKCIYIRVTDNEIAILGLYVDDILILTKTAKLMNQVKDQIKSAFQVKDSGEVKRILGIQAHRTDNELTLDQSQYVKKLLQEYGMEDCKPVATPIDGHESLDPARPDEERTDQHAYQKRVGSLMYLMTGTRPDLAFAVSKLSQFCHDPTVRHANALNRVLRYVSGTVNHGLCFRSEGSPVIYSDSAYGDDKNDRKSTYGHALLYGQAACTWTSKKQRGVATSTTEAEYVALTEAAKTIVWTTRWLQEVLQRDLPNGPIRLLGDNKGSLALVKNPEHHQRTKHIDIQYHYVRQVYEDGLLQADYVPTSDQAADILTKPLTTQPFQHCRELLGVYDLTSN